MAASPVNRYIFKRHLLRVNLFDRTYARARGAANDALAARCGLGGGVRQHPGSTTALKGGLLPFLVFIQLLARAGAAPAAMMTGRASAARCGRNEKDCQIGLSSLN